jgi:hypothetical protein
MLIWNVMGGINFFTQMNSEIVAAYRESERAVIEGRPAWAPAGFAIAVFGGVFGCLLLLFRKSAAVYLFIASLLGVIVTMIHTLSGGIFDLVCEIRQEQRLDRRGLTCDWIRFSPYGRSGD